MKTLCEACFICSGALPLAPENDQVGDCPAVHCTAALVDAVWMDATDGSKVLNVIAPGVVLKVHAAPALHAAPNSNANKRQEVFQRRCVAIVEFMAKKTIIEGSSSTVFMKAPVSVPSHRLVSSRRHRDDDRVRVDA